MTFKELENIRKSLKLDIAEFVKQVGIARSTFYFWKDKNEVPRADAELILRLYRDSKDKFELPEYSGAKSLIPYFDVIATASTKEVNVVDNGNKIQSLIDVGDLLPKAECVIRVAGNSMIPNYPPGCLIGLRRIFDGLFDYGSVYVIETEDNRFVKRVFKGKDDEAIQLYSDNDQTYDSGARSGMLMYEPFNLPKKLIKRLFKVVGCAKLNDHSHIPDF
ncbi:MAG TPA: S24 family peptidase [Bacteroidia bacterium]|nr:S24 family peptidase [Bacteroidia bacterium]